MRLKDEVRNGHDDPLPVIFKHNLAFLAIKHNIAFAQCYA